MSKKFWIGCDISSKTFWIAVATVEDLGMDWIKLPNREFSHCAKGVTEFLGWLNDLGVGEQEVAGICLEATGRYSMRWALLLDGRLGAVSIVNPARPKAFGASLGIRDKSDRVDACVCTMFGRMKSPKPTTFRSPKHQALCEQFRCYQALDSQRIANEQRLNDGPSSESVCVA